MIGHVHGKIVLYHEDVHRSNEVAARAVATHQHSATVELNQLHERTKERFKKRLRGVIDIQKANKVKQSKTK